MVSMPNDATMRPRGSRADQLMQHLDGAASAPLMTEKWYGGILQKGNPADDGHLLNRRLLQVWRAWGCQAIETPEGEPRNAQAVKRRDGKMWRDFSLQLAKDNVTVSQASLGIWCKLRHYFWSLNWPADRISQYLEREAGGKSSGAKRYIREAAAV